MDRIAQMMRDTGLDFPSVVQLLALEAGITICSEPRMPLPPDEAERRAWIEAYMAGAHAEWRDGADQVQLSLGTQGRAVREVLVAAIKALGLVDFLGARGPSLQESDASKAFDRRYETKAPRP